MTTSTLDAYLTHRPDRCSRCGFHVRTQGHGTPCTTDEWSVFLDALRSSVRPNGTVHVNDVRPKVQHIFHKHRGQLWTRAQREGYIAYVGKEPSTDAGGKNLDKDARVYRALPRLTGTPNLPSSPSG